MTAWMDPSALLVTGAVVAGALDCGAVGAGAGAGAGARDAETDVGESSGSESVSILSHFE
jgi:hypothetical protein